MKRAAKSAVCVLALILFAAPTMTCLVSTEMMSVAGHECCKKMAAQCGKAGMSQMHRCCQQVGGTDALDLALMKSKPVTQDSLAVAFQPFTTLALAQIRGDISSIQNLATSHGPPGPINSILRI